MSADLEILLIVSVTAMACALPGVFLVLRRMALISDAISHAILFGIVLGFFLVQDLASAWLIVGAALSGVLTVYLVEALQRTGRVHEDAAIGLVFPILFSIGVILISRYAKNIHLDTDAVLRGSVELAYQDRLVVAGRDLGPESLYVMLVVLLVNVGLIGAFYKELKLTTFDTALASALGFSPALLHYGLMTVVSVTAVGAFDVVGSPLVVALMIGPPAAAYLLTERLSRMLLWSAFLAVLSSVLGYFVARAFDVTIAGSCATMTGVTFAAALLLSPSHGLVAAAVRRRRQRWVFAQTMLAIHLFHHEGLPEAAEECRIAGLHQHLRWAPRFVDRVVRLAEREALVVREGEMLALTPRGRDLARAAIVD